MPTYLLDTCTLIWQSTGQPNQIPPNVATILADPGSSLAVSVISFMEIAFKVSAGRLSFPIAFRLLEQRIVAAGGTIYSIDTALLDAYRNIPIAHPDPFDRLIAATAIAAGATILSPDTSFDVYGASRLWV